MKIKDSSGKKIGSIKETSSGKRKLFDKGERLLGYYDPKTNKTYDSHGSYIGSGDQLCSFLV